MANIAIEAMAHRNSWFLPIKNGDFPVRYVSLPEGIELNGWPAQVQQKGFCERRKVCILKRRLVRMVAQTAQTAQTAQRFDDWVRNFWDLMGIFIYGKRKL